jgi:hypothetical protein
MYRLFILSAILFGETDASKPIVAPPPQPQPQSPQSKPPSPVYEWLHSLGLAATGNSAPRYLRGSQTVDNSIQQIKSILSGF